ncbi:MAG: response regulator [Geminicoccaceae bacterium]
MGEATAEQLDQTQAIRTILVVEDEVLIRLAVAEYLRSCGYRILEARDGDEALQILRSSETVELLFSDIQLPGSMNGFELARWASRHRRGIKIILTSGVARSATQAADLCEHGPSLAKPYTHDELLRRVRLLLASANNGSA